MRITTAPSCLHSAQGRSVSLGHCNATESKKQKEILQSTAAINIIYFLASLTVKCAPSCLYDLHCANTVYFFETAL